MKDEGGSRSLSSFRLHPFFDPVLFCAIMLADMVSSRNLIQFIAAAALLLFLASCTQAVAPAPGAETTTPVVGPATQTPPLVAFPTAAPSTPTPQAPVTGTLTAPRASLSIPLVQLVSPVSDTQVSISQTTYVVAYAADDSGIARIELYDDNALARAEPAPPSAPLVFSAIIPWTPTNLGNHTLRVVAYDVSGKASAPAETTVSVVPDTRRPAVVILYPLGTPQVELGSVLPIQAAAIDEVAVTQLDLLIDNQLVTYAAAPKAAGQSPFPIVFAWQALTPGTHTLVVRAHDNQDATTDSSPVKVQVVDTHTPVLSVAFDRTSAPANEPITVTVSALDVSGIQRIELWAGKEIASVTTSANPARQTSMTVQTTWQNATAGDYQLFARAYNANGNFKESPPQTITILNPGQLLPTAAPTAAPTRTRAPRPTATPPLQPPAPPIAQMLAPNDQFNASAPLRVTFGGKGNAELDHLELWGYTQDQPMPQLVCTVDARATTEKNALCDWTPATAGVVYLFAQAIDSYHQVSRSATISGYIGVPAVPLVTATPMPVSFAGRWTAPAFTATLRQSGSALRGDFKMTVNGSDLVGRITSGTVRSDGIAFHVEFAPAVTPTATFTSTPTVTPGAKTPTAATPTLAATPTATVSATPAMDFDCSVDTAITALSCNWKDARGRSGSVVFQRESNTP